jgi:hypothetical protein
MSGPTATHPSKKLSITLSVSRRLFDHRAGEENQAVTDNLIIMLTCEIIIGIYDAINDHAFYFVLDKQVSKAVGLSGKVHTGNIAANVAPNTDPYLFMIVSVTT